MYVLETIVTRETISKLDMFDFISLSLKGYYDVCFRNDSNPDTQYFEVDGVTVNIPLYGALL